ncbi:MAG: bifunctional 5,10-methylenetetrahydrofolate dehydrogenase/5,10-methenyltetrahydrofolate cyclohydrolase [Candidatus Dormibacteraceae bacterium]
MVVLDGKALAGEVLDGVSARIRALIAEGRPRPHLATVLVGEDPASLIYIRGKHRDAEKVGIESSDHRLPESATTAEVLAVVRRLNADPAVAGILVQQPFPRQVEVRTIVEAVAPEKDVDGLGPLNAGRLLAGEPGHVPCTPAGILRLLDRHHVPLEGSRATVVGRSSLVGKPTALLLLQRNATVTICHSRTRDLAGACRQADVLVVAIGRTRLVEAGWVKEGAAVVDVGMNRLDGKLTGDVDPAAATRAGWLTPVPGGVGPMTRAMLMENTLRAEELRRP